MGVSYKYAKYIAKTGTYLLIPLLVLDTTWTLIRYILFNSVMGGTIPDRFIIIDSIVTNFLFTVFFSVLTAGLVMLTFYYWRISKIGLIASSLLIILVGVKIAFIFYRFTQLFVSMPLPILDNLFYIFELTTSTLLILGFIIFDAFQRQLKSRKDIGLGGSFIPYIFGFFALIYPISNILSLAGVLYQENVAALAIMQMLSYIGSILEIILYFDILRRLDAMHTLEKDDENSIIELNIKAQKMKKELEKSGTN